MTLTPTQSPIRNDNPDKGTETNPDMNMTYDKSKLEMITPIRGRKLIWVKTGLKS